MNLKIKGVTGIKLNGNKLSGNTFPVKSWIQSYVSGTWDASSKSWVVDTDKLNNLIAKGANVYVDNSQPQQPAKASNWYTNTRYGRELSEDC